MGGLTLSSATWLLSRSASSWRSTALQGPVSIRAARATRAIRKMRMRVSSHSAWAARWEAIP